MSISLSLAQNWAWMKGSNTISQSGTYGTQGVAAATNTPAAREGSVSWTDAAGNFWLFGGYWGINHYNDLWKYVPTTNQWTWMKGGNVPNISGTYGTLGIPAPSNTPGAREYSASWIDTGGNLWLFGGEDSGGFLNDLWKYDPSTNQWVCMKGSNVHWQTGTYGTKGVAATANTPGARDQSFSWTDASGNLLLFGGYSGNTFGDIYNDLWKYDPTSNKWTWINGSNTPNQIGIYGTQGISASTNVPGARNAGASWKDANGNFWLFGGTGYSATNKNYLNDLWKYNPATNNWTWINGTDTTNQNGIYGTQGISAPANMPGSRVQSVSWSDPGGNLWLWGGYYNGFLFNDLWEYNPGSNQWTWMKGSNGYNQVGTYGTQGTPASGNTPSCRSQGVSWTDASGNLWCFGGYGKASSGTYGPFNDVWRFCNTYAPQGSTLQSFCSANNPTIANLSAVGSNIKWYGAATGGSPLATSTVLVNGTHYYASQTISGCGESFTRLDVAVSILNSSGSASVSITASPSNTICSGSNVIFTAVPVNGGTTPSYQWRVNSTNVGTNSTSYSSTTLANNDTLSVVMTSNAVCPIGNPATSTPIIMTVTQTVTPSVTIIASPSGAICNGTNVIFTATPQNGGTTPSYLWTINGIITGSNSPTYSSSTLSDGDSIDVTITSNASCITSITASSNMIPMTVVNSVATPASISGTTMVCDGSSAIYSTPLVSGASDYLWTLPSGWIGSSSNNVINVTANTNSGKVTVAAVNGCDTSLAQNLNVTLNLLPSVTFSALSNVCDTVSQFVLNGGSPSGGTYSGVGVSGGMFAPSIAGVGSHAIMYAVTDVNSCTSSAASTIQVNSCNITRINNSNTVGNISISPNPFSDFTIISLGNNIPLNNASITIYDTKGGTVISYKNINSNEIRVDKQNMREGLYYFQIFNNDKLISTGKLILME